MRFHRLSRRAVRSRVALLLAAGVAIGAIGGLQVAGVIERAGFGGTFGAPALPPAEPESAKPSEEDRHIGAALAAATHADDLADCRSLEPRHQAGCRSYVQDRRSGDSVFDGLGAARSGNEAAPLTPAARPSSATDWPAAFD